MYKAGVWYFFSQRNEARIVNYYLIIIVVFANIATMDSKDENVNRQTDSPVGTRPQGRSPSG